MMEQNEDAVPLLFDGEAILHQHRREKSQLNRHPIILLSCYSFMITCVLLYVGLWMHQSSLPYSPVQSVVQFQVQDVKPGKQTVFSSEPSDELQVAWRKLLAKSYVSVTEEEIVRSGDDPRNSVKLREGDYLAVLGVYHQLHCLRWFYYSSHQEVYWPNDTNQERANRQEHGRHCIQVLLDYIKCKPDIALYTVGYNASTNLLPELRYRASWQCVNWDLIEDWAGSRAVGSNAELVVPDSFWDKEAGVNI